MLASAVGGVALAVGATTVPAPTITAKPANPTNQTSAHFAYADSQAGVTFRCQLDTASAASCPSTGITYSGLAAGSHTFAVQAVSGTKTSAQTSYTWKVDTAAPALTLAFPKNGGLYNSTAWNGGCSGGAGICGSATDPSGVASVVVSILQQSTARYWNGSSFSSSSEVFNTAAGTTSWRYALTLPSPDGSYTVHVRATDAVGNSTPSAAQLIASFTIDTQPPPVPSITSGPERTTSAKNQSFTFSDGESGVAFLCRVDNGSFSACRSPATYEIATQGEHVFYVEARDAAGNVSAAASYAWTTVKPGEGKTFTIAGNLAGPLAPGVSRPLPLAVSNPNNVTIYVTSLVAAVRSGSTNAGCDGPTNLQVTQANTTSTHALVIPAYGRVTLPAGSVSAPQVLMKNLASNQDSCKGATFTFSYSGIAHS
jgi:large repetitive protein